jgi:hypothetical protein
MPRLTITSDSRSYDVSPDDTVEPANRLRALVVGQLLDELTGEAPRVRAELEVREAGLVSYVSPDNVFSLAGVALQQFSFLATQDYQIHLRLAAPGYVALELTATVAQTPSFPSQLPTLVDLGRVLLHREPVVIGGRIMQNAPTPSPIAGATVQITGVWPTLPGPNVAWPVANPPNLVSVRGSICSARDVTTDKARTVTLSLTPDPAKSLTNAVAAGANKLMLDNRVGLTLAGGDILAVDSGTSAEEFVNTTLVRGTSTDDQPAEVTLGFPLANSHPHDAIVRRVNPVSPGGDKTLTRPAIAGDSVLFVSDLIGWGAAATIEIRDPATPANSEYHAFSSFAVSTDAGGFYRLPPISRVEALELEAQGPTTAKVTQTIDYTEPINHVDFRL